MGNKKSKAPGKSGGLVNAEHTSVYSNGAASDQQNNVQMVQNVHLIWLDNNMDDNSADCRNTIAELRRAVNTINKYTDGEQCIKFLKNMDGEKACIIISGTLGRPIVPRIHNMSQVDSIFIFCGNKNYHEDWAKQWSKIRGVFTEILPICEALKQAAQQCEQNAIPISFVSTSDDISKKNLDQLDPSFMYTQILKEILLTIKFEPEHFTAYIDYCRDVFIENEGELKNVNQFERKYHDETPIWWYTYECFLYPMLNRNLRLMDVDIIIKMGFFIGDLHRHIELLHSTQFGAQNSGKTFMVYRGQGMSKAEFEQMSKTKGGLLSFNNFLSTSKNRKISLDFANRAATNPDLVGIHFVMTIDPAKSTTPFASTVDVSCYKDKEDEVLFAMHAVFRICDIQPVGGNHRLFQVELTLTSDNDKFLRQLTDHIREKTHPVVEGWQRLGAVLFQMGQSDKAEEVYETLLAHTANEDEKGNIYDRLGRANYNKAEYKKAIEFYEKALAIRQQSLPPNHPDLAASYNNIGLVYFNMREYSKELSSHQKALEIQQQSLPPNHPDLATSYNNIGLVYCNMGEYSKALSSHQKALAIQQQSLPPNHPDLAVSYNNIGVVYNKVSEYSKALPYFEKALEINKKTLPSNHPDLAKFYITHGNINSELEEYSKAVGFYEKALEIQKQSLPSNHPDLAMSYNNVGAMCEKMGEYSKASSFYGSAVNIAQFSLPSNHPHLQIYRENLDLAKKEIILVFFSQKRIK